MLTTLIIAATLAGQCQPGMACYRAGYSYAPQMTCASGSCYTPQVYAPYIPPQPGPAPAPAPAPTPAPAPSPNARRPVPPSPYKAAAGPTVAELDRKIGELAEQVKALCGPKRAGPSACTCGPECKCTCGCGGRVASSPPPVTAFRFH